MPAPERVQVFLMSASRSGPRASLPAVIGTCSGGERPSCQDILTDGTGGRAGVLQGFPYLKLLHVINHTHTVEVEGNDEI